MANGLIADFFSRRLTVLGCARKYGLTVKQVEARIRRVMRKGKGMYA